MFIFLLILSGLVLLALVFLQQPQFGSIPSGKRLERILSSPHSKKGKFQNIEITPQLTEGASFGGIVFNFLFKKNKRSIPKSLPSVKTNLKELPETDLLVWFGHSSYYLQLAGKKILVDPVFSGSASPFSITTKSFKGTDVYSATDLPFIDYLIITHDHYDHLDYKTILKLKGKVGKVITGLGVGAHLEKWNFDPAILSELDWNENMVLDDKITIHSTTARHFSGRKFQRNNTLWSSFVLSTSGSKIFIGGDSGYGDHFKIIGEQFGPFDLAILENGQYNKHWKHIHLMPEEVVKAAADLKSKRVLPVHWAKFSLSTHDWDEPIIRLMREADRKNLSVLSPMIGEVVFLDHPGQNNRWWQNVEEA